MSALEVLGLDDHFTCHQVGHSVVQVIVSPFAERNLYPRRAETRDLNGAVCMQVLGGQYMTSGSD
jgi:hypothetical protein